MSPIIARTDSSSRVRLALSATNLTSASLVSSGSVSTRHCGLMSQLNTTRSGGW
jgi:hypothetical protein